MNSDTGAIPTPQRSDPEGSGYVSDAARIANVLGAIALVMFLLVAAGLLMAVELVGENRPGYIEVDQQEIADATSLVESRSSKLDDLKQESETIKQQIARIRSGEATRIPSGWPERDASTSPQSSQNVSLGAGKFREPDQVSRLYCLLFLSRSRGAMSQLGQLTPDQKRDLARLVLSGVEVGQADLSIAANVIALIGDSESKARLIRHLFSSPAVFMGGLQSESTGVVMITLCESIPGSQRGERIRDLVMEFSSVKSVFVLAAEQSASRISEDEREVLAVWITHPDQEIRQLADRIVPAASLWEHVANTLAGNEYNKFVYANRWLAGRPVNDRYRKNVLAALGPMLFVRDGEAMPSLDTFCKWADHSAADTIGGHLTTSVKNPQVIQRLIETAIRIELPLVSMIDQSKDEPANQWFKQYLDGDPQVSRAFRKLLASDPPLPSAIRWMDRISRQGGKDQMKDLELAVQLIKNRNPDSLLANRAEESLRKMQRKLAD